MYPYFETPFLKSINVDRVSAYNIFGAAALFFALILIIYLIRRFRLPYIRTVLLILPGYYSGLVFSRFLFFLSVYGKVFFQNNTIYSVFQKIFLSPLEGGQVFYGGVLGSLLGILILGFRFFPRREILRILDITIMALLLISATGRLGCFFQGCCYGIPSVLFGINFHPMSTAAQQWSLRLASGPFPPLFPVQLVESLTSGIIFSAFLLQIVGKREKSAGYYFYYGLLMHSFIRFNLEWFRYDNRGSFWIFSTTQWITLILLTLLIIGRIVCRMINITSTETEK